MQYDTREQRKTSYRFGHLMEENIKANAAMAVEQLRPLSGIDFGYNPESVEWLQGYNGV